MGKYLIVCAGWLVVTTVKQLLHWAGVSSLTVERQRLSVEAVSVETYCLLLRRFQRLRGLSYFSYLVARFLPGATTDYRCSPSSWRICRKWKSKSEGLGGWKHESMSFVHGIILIHSFSKQ